jgi:hypothetical protein
VLLVLVCWCLYLHHGVCQLPLLPAAESAAEAAALLLSCPDAAYLAVAERLGVVLYLAAPLHDLLLLLVLVPAQMLQQVQLKILQELLPWTLQRLLCCLLLVALQLQPQSHQCCLLLLRLLQHHLTQVPLQLLNHEQLWSLLLHSWEYLLVQQQQHLQSQS